MNKITKQPKIQLQSWSWALLLLVFLSPLILFLFKFGEHMLTVRISGYIALPLVEIRASTDGYVSKVAVKSGQNLKEGEFLSQLEQPELKKQLSLLKSELDYLRNNPTAKGIKDAVTLSSSSLSFAEKQKNYLKKRLTEVTQLFSQGAATDAEVKFAQFQYEQAMAHLVDLQAAMARAKDTALIMKSDEESQEDLRIKQLIMDEKKLELQVKALSIFSPIAGSVSDVFAVEGSYVSRGDRLFAIIKNEKAYVNVYLPIEHIKYSQVGQEAMIAFADGERVSGKVVKAARGAIADNSLAYSSPEPKTNEFMMQLEFTQAIHQKLIDGMPVEVFF